MLISIFCSGKISFSGFITFLKLKILFSEFPIIKEFFGQFKFPLFKIEILKLKFFSFIKSL